MIVGFGIDAVENERFREWDKKSPTELSRLFSSEEIEYCLSNSKKAAERFAARFAAREALYKALTPLAPQEIPLLTLTRATTIRGKDHKEKTLALRAPILEVDWALFDPDLSWLIMPHELTFHLTLTHTTQIAIAAVIIEKRS